MTCRTLFLGLGDLDGGAVSSLANAISRDGTTVVGQSDSASGPEAMRWRAETGMVGLGDLAGAGFVSLAYDVSADGEVVVGTSSSSLSDCPGRFDEAFRWSPASGMVALGDLPTGCFWSHAYGISADGQVVVGGASNALSNTAATWSNGWTDLGFAASTGNSSAIEASTRDGGVLVGTQRVDATASYEAFLWSSGAGREILGDLDGGDVYASALAVSDDGRVAVGFGTSSDGVEAFRWTRDGGLAGLGDFAGGAASSIAAAISGDGTLIVGSGANDAGSQAALWSASLAITPVAQQLAAHGVVVPAGWSLTAATGVTLNGTEVSISGNGTNPSGAPEAWVARYCSP